jgi:hypothetical protein
MGGSDLSRFAVGWFGEGRPKPFVNPVPNQGLIWHFALFGDLLGPFNFPLGKPQRYELLPGAFLNFLMPFGIAQEQLIHVGGLQLIDVICHAMGIPKVGFFLGSFKKW